MLRSIILILTVTIFLILGIPLLIAEWVLGKWNMEAKSRSSLAIVLWVFRVCLSLTGAGFTVLGMENVPTDRPVLYVANHRSLFDILMLYVRVPRLTGFVAKKEINFIPLLNNWMRNLHCLFLDRKDLRQGMKTILACIEKVKNGISICIFPEGTRSKGYDGIQPFRDGSFKIAEKTGCPIIPVTINHSEQIFEAHVPFVRKAHVVIEYGKPVIMAELPRENRLKIGDYVHAVMTEAYERNKHA